jgi:dihydrolipoamide dehydrogenase
MPLNIVIIGGGPGGYVAAIQATRLGALVTLVEKDNLGGTCLNRGCIPTKTLIESAELFKRIQSAGTLGIAVEKATVDFGAINKRKEEVVNRLISGLTSLMVKNKIRVMKGTAVLIDSRTVGIADGGEKIKADNIIIATGSKCSTLPVEGVTGPGVINSDQVLNLEKLPDSLIIIGGGVVGLEFAGIMQGLGVRVTIVEMMPHLLPAADAEITGIIEQTLKKEGIKIFTGARVTGIKKSDGQEAVSFTMASESETHEEKAEKVLISVGRQPDTDGLGSDRVGIALHNKYIAVNERLETNIPGIFAIGDVVGKNMLAHTAMEEGKCAAENILGGNRRVSYDIIPSCLYSSPEIAWAGLTESEARKKYGEVRVGRFPFYASGRALTLNDTTGMVKIIADKRYGQILGVHIIGYNATELIAEAVLAMRMEATIEDLALTVHAYPTLSEAIQEASLDVLGMRIHL